MPTTRQIEERRAFAQAENVQRHHFMCDGGKFTLSAIGLTKEHALRVIKEEYPKATIDSYVEATHCPCPPLNQRLEHNADLRKFAKGNH